MNETKEEIKEMYDTQDEKSINAKVKEGMLEIIKLDDPKQGLPIYEFVMKNFTKGEMAHVTCTYIAQNMAEMIQKNPEFRALCSMLKHLETLQKNKNA